MRFKCECKVDGNVFLDNPPDIMRDNFYYSFITDEEKRLTHIALSIKIPDEKRSDFTGSIEPGIGLAKLSISFDIDNELHEQLIYELQSFESYLAFRSNSALKRIHWEDVEMEIVGENDEDYEFINVSGLSVNRKYPTVNTNIKNFALEKIINDIPEYQPLIIHYAFWRDGMNFFTSFNYIQAFYNFYFIIEDFYTGGEYQWRKIEPIVKNCSEYRLICNEIITAIKKDDRHLKNINNFMSEHGIPTLDEFGLQKLLHMVRGTVHHFFSDKSKFRGTPLNQAEYETIAWITCFIATKAIDIKSKQ